MVVCLVHIYMGGYSKLFAAFGALEKSGTLVKSWQQAIVQEETILIQALIN